MGLLIRTLLIWLLMLAIPAQGVAAATMAFCGPAHHRGWAAATVDRVATPPHSHGDYGAASAHEHAVVQASTPALEEHGGPAKGKVNSSDQHKCNVCGACCSAGALMSALPVLLAADATSASFSFVVATFDPFAADGPDRPPRNLLV